jgi:hypothetical protein
VRRAGAVLRNRAAHHLRTDPVMYLGCPGRAGWRQYALVTIQQRGEPLYPAIDGDVVYLDAALGKQLCHVAVGQPVAQLPTHRQHDGLTGGSGIQRNPTSAVVLDGGDDASAQPALPRPPPTQQRHRKWLAAWWRRHRRRSLLQRWVTRGLLPVTPTTRGRYAAQVWRTRAAATPDVEGCMPSWEKSREMANIKRTYPALRAPDLGKGALQQPMPALRQNHHERLAVIL